MNDHEKMTRRRLLKGVAAVATGGVIGAALSEPGEEKKGAMAGVLVTGIGAAVVSQAINRDPQAEYRAQDKHKKKEQERWYWIGRQEERHNKGNDNGPER